MKVLHLIDHLSLGGAQRAVRDLVVHRPQDRVLALRLKAPGATMDLPQAAVIHPGARTPLGYPSLLPRAWLTQRQGGFDLIHCHLPVSWMFGIMLAELEGQRPALLFHERGGVLHRHGPDTWLLRAAARRGLIVCVSGYIRDRVAERGVEDGDLFVMHNAIDLNYFRPSPDDGLRFLRRAGVGRKTVLAGFAGRLVPDKGWRVLLEALAQTGARSGVRLMIVGIGADAGNLRDFISSSGLGGRVSYLGYAKDMLGFYNALDMCIVPSIIEPFGRVQLEAQACGVPVIASRISGIMETISAANAMLAPPGDAKQLALAIQRMASDSGLREEYRLAGLEMSVALIWKATSRTWKICMPDSRADIRILGYHRTTNPGGVLFCLSLASLIAQVFPSQDVRLLDYISTRKCFYEALKVVKPQLRAPWFNAQRYLLFRRFVGRELPLDTAAPRLPSTGQLVDYLNSRRVSAVVVGMDTWNLSDKWFLERFPNIFWLPRGLRAAKIAYAVSAHRSSHARIAARLDALRSTLNGLDLIGARDHFTQEMISHVGVRSDLHVRRLLDPTFLYPIPSMDGDEALAKWGLDPERPIVGWMVHGRAGLSVRAIGDFRSQGFQIIAPSIYNPYADVNLGHILDPAQWAAIFPFMDFCVTDRYHGAIFCLKSKTPFLSIEPSGLESPLHSKHRSLLLDFGLLDCYLSGEGISAGEFRERVQHVRCHWKNWLPSIEAGISEARRQHSDFLSEMREIALARERPMA